MAARGCGSVRPKRQRAGLWLAWVAVTNVGLVVYLQSYQQAIDRFVFGLPEAFVVLVAFVFVVTGTNASFAWYYLGKPDVGDVFRPEPKPDSATETPDVSETTGTEET